VLVFTLPNFHAAQWVARRLAYSPYDATILGRYETRFLVPTAECYIPLPWEPGQQYTQLVDAALWQQLPVWRSGCCYVLQPDTVPFYIHGGLIHLLAVHVDAIGVVRSNARPLPSEDEEKEPESKPRIGMVPKAKMPRIILWAGAARH
jgi:hypothetical protein